MRSWGESPVLAVNRGAIPPSVCSARCRCACRCTVRLGHIVLTSSSMSGAAAAGDCLQRQAGNYGLRVIVENAKPCGAVPGGAPGEMTGWRSTANTVTWPWARPWSRAHAARSRAISPRWWAQTGVLAAPWGLSAVGSSLMSKQGGCWHPGSAWQARDETRARDRSMGDPRNLAIAQAVTPSSRAIARPAWWRCPPVRTRRLRADDRNVSCPVVALFSRAVTRMNTTRQGAIDVLSRPGARAGTGP